MRWTDTIERMMLLKVIEQNPGTKFDAAEALATWPYELDAPTKRGLGDRFSLVKRQIKEGTIAHTVGAAPAASSGAWSTPSGHRRNSHTIPKTPKSSKSSGKAKSSSGGGSNKKLKQDFDGVEGEQSDDNGEVVDKNDINLANPVKINHGSSVSFFKARLLGAGKGKPGGAGKRKRVESDEESMSSHMSDSNSGENGDGEDGQPSLISSEKRRSLPLRRSKSATPASYVIEEDSEGDGSHTEKEDNGKQGKRGRGKVKQEDIIIGADDSDGLFD